MARSITLFLPYILLLGCVSLDEHAVGLTGFGLVSDSSAGTTEGGDRPEGLSTARASLKYGKSGDYAYQKKTVLRRIVSTTGSRQASSDQKIVDHSSSQTHLQKNDPIPNKYILDPQRDASVKPTNRSQAEQKKNSRTERLKSLQNPRDKKKYSRGQLGDTARSLSQLYFDNSYPIVGASTEQYPTISPDPNPRRSASGSPRVMSIALGTNVIRSSYNPFEGDKLFNFNLLPLKNEEGFLKFALIVSGGMILFICFIAYIGCKLELRRVSRLSQENNYHSNNYRSWSQIV